MDSKQQYAYNQVLKNKSVFITSAAGCGKSFTLGKIVRSAKERDVEVGVTAMTASAALLIHGRTLHSYLGIGLGTKDASTLAFLTKTKNKKLYNRLRRLNILIIDEVSMLDAALCDKISAYLQLVRQDSRPFGGVVMVFCGDLFQLRPVKGDYCFKAAAWEALNPTVVLLETQYRQDNDTIFANMLTRLRWGRCSKEDLLKLKACKDTSFPPGIEPTKVYSLNVDVDTINFMRFEKVCETSPPEKIIKYPTVGMVPKGTNIQESVTLCPGLQVVVTWNIAGTNIVNGTRGIIVDTRDTSVVIKTMHGYEVVIEYLEYTPENAGEDERVRFMPLKLAYAVSVHKTQGMTLDCMQIDLGNTIFEYGQAYTALSRARSLASVKIVDVADTSFKAHPDVVNFYTQANFESLEV